MTRARFIIWHTVPQLERRPSGGKIFCRWGKNLCLFLVHEFLILISKLLLISKKNRSSHPIGLFFSEFSVGLQNKKEKKSSSQHLETDAREKILHILHYYGQFGGHTGQFGKAKVLFEGRRPWSPLVAALMAQCQRSHAQMVRLFWSSTIYGWKMLQ